MFKIIYFAILFIVISAENITITQNYIDRLLTDCYDSSNNPIPNIDYECNSDCQVKVQLLYNQMKQISQQVQPFQPCDQWYAYVNNDLDEVPYDESDIQNGIFELYGDCLYEYQLIAENVDDNVYKIYQCAQQIAQNQQAFQVYDTIVTETQVNSCRNECETVVQCDSSCKSAIDTDFDNTEQVCQDTIDIQNEDFQDGVTQNQYDFSEDAGQNQVYCIQENIDYNTDYDIANTNIDWNLLDVNEDIIGKYSVYNNLQTQKEKMKVTLKCYTECYHYTTFLDELFEYTSQNYDNLWAFAEYNILNNISEIPQEPEDSENPQNPQSPNNIQNKVNSQSQKLSVLYSLIIVVLILFI